MEKIYINDKRFEKIDFNPSNLSIGEYENCVFFQCDFSASSFSQIEFISCEFEECNLSNVALKKTSLKDVRFKNCKMLGLHFEDCNPFLFKISIDSCMLNLSAFYQSKLKNTQFKKSSLHEVDFTEAVLTQSNFSDCDLLHANFDRTNLEKSDFRTSYNYTFDPDKNNIKKAKFSIPEVIGLLNKYDIQIS